MGKLIKASFDIKFTRLGLENACANFSTSLAMLTSVLKALPGKLDIKKHSPSILYISAFLVVYS